MFDLPAGHFALQSEIRTSHEESISCPMPPFTVRHSGLDWFKEPAVVRMKESLTTPIKGAGAH